MSTHSNPITNVTPKNRVKKLKRVPTVIKHEEIPDCLSLLEMSMYKIKKYFKS